MGLLLQQILFLVLLQCCVVVRSRPQGEELKAPVSNERSQLKEVGRFRKSVDTSVCWRHVTPGCVNAHNIKRYRGKSVHQCKELCAKNSDCKAFEYGVSHGGSKKHYRTGDCQLNSGSNSAGCDGVANNLDLYIQISCTPVGITNSKQEKQEKEVLPYASLGCYKDEDSAITSGRGELYRISTIIDQCYKRAKSLGHKFFVIKYQYMCYTKSDDIGQTYAKYGKTRGCRNGKGDEWWQMNVYEIGGESNQDEDDDKDEDTDEADPYIYDDDDDDYEDSCGLHETCL